MKRAGASLDAEARQRASQGRENERVRTVGEGRAPRCHDEVSRKHDDVKALHRERTASRRQSNAEAKQCGGEA